MNVIRTAIMFPLKHVWQSVFVDRVELRIVKNPTTHVQIEMHIHNSTQKLANDLRCFHHTNKRPVYYSGLKTAAGQANPNICFLLWCDVQPALMDAQFRGVWACGCAWLTFKNSDALLIGDWKTAVPSSPCLVQHYTTRLQTAALLLLTDHNLWCLWRRLMCPHQ